MNLILTISFAFPLISTFKSLKTNDINLIKSWLIYWIVFGSLTILEFQFYNLILKYLPFYSIIKLYLSIWLILPNTKGYEFIYFNYIDEYLGRYEIEIDSFVNKLYAKNPLEFVLNLLKTLKIISSDQSSNNTSSSYTSNGVNQSIFDSFANSIISKQSNPKQTQQQNNIFESLVGVLQYFPKPTGSTRSTRSTTPTGSTGTTNESRSLNTTTTTANTSNDDYDFVGKDEYENIDETTKLNTDSTKDLGNELKQTKVNNGWFSWWNNGYTPIDESKKHE
ncbi:Receptor expression-enhancing protein 2 [Wickerhamomyces ciferrii]|uniref:Protein YOP1 n=1 Tax=Wickerhamomyces ciferrii (strain ATCC 14091 / BCRC 22168 / CBS 111 / JCM 3599 / NBRC 0793 / NRRL Y-1031 F-60-10) TaxID=1206466 RepID=K0KNE2_WICCF|nr:Receptor expression-enhancing protein 2 [Wickerhamomyces ciferrii]CCH43702.1 Receptor expression-enhancing protein 2 [Wickerhamomyces ciferrii]